MHTSAKLHDSTRTASGLDSVGASRRGQPSARSDGGCSPRQVTRGESSLSIDWLSFTFPLVDGWQSWLESALGSAFGLQGWKDRNGGMNGYAYSATVGPAVIAWGGQSTRGTVYVSVPGSVTGAVGAQAWVSIARLLEARQCRITRVDIAYDDFESKAVSVRRALAWYKRGGFTSNGRPPAAQLIDDMGTDKGCTLYVGSRKNGKLLRVYEKGKQLGAAASKWVRVELQLGNRDRVLPWSVLTRPADVLAGAYPVLHFISEARLTIKAIKASHLLKLAHCIKHAKLQAGPVIHALLRVEGGDYRRVFDQLIAWGRFPRRLDTKTLMECPT